MLNVCSPLDKTFIYMLLLRLYKRCLDKAKEKKREKMKTTTENTILGDIVYDESIWTGKKVITVNGEQLAKIDKKDFPPSGRTLRNGERQHVFRCKPYSRRTKNNHCASHEMVRIHSGAHYSDIRSDLGKLRVSVQHIPHCRRSNRRRNKRTCNDFFRCRNEKGKQAYI